ncbi:SRPBCC family protein [Brevibacillus sp. MER 51]|uniref:CoxG family protein n=1 Tax=Brevibacillus sp. MER 51 TaxID=2939560 RepID=UPI00203DF5C6|nr:SRPBCC family protein [Brevibacillus sp. MER 51]MCM3146247.1 SRPBCC family protein [Brevibacillus sp. MER 51]
MPQGIHDVELNLPIGAVWQFVSIVENWVPLVPGYISHEVINERRVAWTFTGDIGIMKKTISLQVDITEWTPPTEVKFTLTGISGNFTGHGYFKAKALGEARTKMTGCLDITAHGVKGPMINSILKSNLPKTTRELVDAIAKRLHSVTR